MLKIQPALGKWWFLCDGKQPVEDMAPIETVTIQGLRVGAIPIKTLARSCPDWGNGRLWRMQDTIRQEITK
jgi:hypothetical protein